MNFNTYYNLTEAKTNNPKATKVAVFVFGRFNPPTMGHSKLFDKLVEAGKEKDGDTFVFPSQSVDKKKDPEKSKNPLDYEIKVVFLKRLFPNANIVKDETVKTPFDVLRYLDERGYTEIYFVVGSDRMKDFVNMNKYANETFDKFGLISAGERDPDAEDVAGMSATKAREAAKKRDIGGFRAATGFRGDDARHLMKAVRTGMGL